MGKIACKKEDENSIHDAMDERAAINRDFVFHRNHMDNYGCGNEFETALRKCNPGLIVGGAADDGACAKATAALRRCMELDRVHFRAYISAMDKGLDEDERRAVAGEPPLPQEQEDFRIRWWTGMKRT